MTERPPALARFILVHAAPPDVGEFVLGDLAEEYEHRAARSIADARRWFWTQVLSSCPQFLWRRLTRHGIKTLATLCAATAAAYALIITWDIQIARQLTLTLAQSTTDTPLLLLRAFYVAAQALAFGAVGMAISYFTFRPDESFRRNALLRLSPIAAVQFIPAFAASLFASNGYSLWFLLPWCAVTAAALLGGAFLARIIRL